MSMLCYVLTSVNLMQLLFGDVKRFYRNFLLLTYCTQCLRTSQMQNNFDDWCRHVIYSLPMWSFLCITIFVKSDHFHQMQCCLEFLCDAICCLLMLVVMWTDLRGFALSAYKVQHHSHGCQTREYSDVLYGGSRAPNCSRSCRMAAARH